MAMAISNANYDYSIKVWDLATMQEIHDLTGHRGPVGTMVFTPDSKTLISASTDLTIRTWDLTP